MSRSDRAELERTALREALRHRVPPLPFTTRSRTRQEQTRRVALILGGALLAFAVLATAVLIAVGQSMDRTVSSSLTVLLWTFAMLGAAIAVLVSLAWHARVSRYRDAGLLLTLDEQGLTLRRTEGDAVRAGWGEITVVSVLLARNRSAVVFLGVVLDCRGARVALDNSALHRGAAAAALAVQRLRGAGRIAA